MRGARLARNQICGLLALVFWVKIHVALVDFLKATYKCKDGGGSVVGTYGCPSLGFSFALCVAAVFFSLAGVAARVDRDA